MQSGGKTRIGAMACAGLVLGMLPAAGLAHVCVGKRHYQATGYLKVELPAALQAATGLQEGPIVGAKVKLKRPGIRGAGGAGPVTTTEPDGRFVAHACFPRDTNGVVPGGQPIDIELEVKFDSPKLRVRDPLPMRSNWHVVTNYSMRGGGNRTLGDIVYGDNTTNFDRFTSHAGIWWAFERELRNFEDNELGLESRVVVTWPHSGTLVNRDTSYAVTQVFLAQNDSLDGNGEPRTMIHEMMHMWHGQILPGNVAPVCLFDGHHNPPTQWNSARCSGFTEGLSEAVARRLMFERYGAAEETPIPHADLMAGTPGLVSFPITSINEVERSDDGWENVFRYLFVSDEWAPDGLASAPACDAADVDVYSLLQALDRDGFSVASPRVAGLLDVLVAEIDGFEQADADIYLALADPSIDPAVLHADLCGAPTANATSGTMQRRTGPPIRIR